MKYVDAQDVCKLVLIDVMILCLWVVDLRFLVLFVKVVFEMSIFYTRSRIII